MLNFILDGNSIIDNQEVYNNSDLPFRVVLSKPDGVAEYPTLLNTDINIIFEFNNQLIAFFTTILPILEGQTSLTIFENTETSLVVDGVLTQDIIGDKTGIVYYQATWLESGYKRVLKPSSFKLVNSLSTS